MKDPQMKIKYFQYLNQPILLAEECSFIFKENSNYCFSYQNSFYGKICASIDAAVSLEIVTATACIYFNALIKMLTHRRVSLLLSFNNSLTCSISSITPNKIDLQIDDIQARLKIFLFKTMQRNMTVSIASDNKKGDVLFFKQITFVK